MAALSAWFWNERFWLPHNVTWADLADPAPGVEYPKASHLLSALPLAAGIFAVRILFERYLTCCLSGCLSLPSESTGASQLILGFFQLICGTIFKMFLKFMFWCL
uniref:Ceramide synthase 5 n=1 Tax=Hucho hucho TaxID=62062 RepID=A0A4W5RRT4_9TELE